MAYVLPGGLAYAPVLLYLVWHSRLDSSSTSFLLATVAMSTAIGIILNMAGHVIFNKWQLDHGKTWKQVRKERCYFEEVDEKPSYLQTLIEAHYPEATALQSKIERIDAIFVRRVSEHIFARRNWEWEFHKASRNFFLASPFACLGLMVIAYLQTRSLLLCLFILVCTIVADKFFYEYMEWSVQTYYTFTVNTVCSHLMPLEHSVQPPTRGNGQVTEREQRDMMEPAPPGL